ncbi:MAG: signal peptidase II, partial [Akkermansiaceae bacterium]|nr:signal peptidase II [Akkermansiaceae bacterium]
MKTMPLQKLLLLITLPLYVLDQATKFWTVFNFDPPSPQRPVDGFPIIEGWFHWVRIHNQGVAFGL